MNHLVHSPESLGALLKSRRKDKKLTQTKAGLSVDLDQTTISSIENGAPGTRLETLFRLLSALELEIVIRPRNTPKSNNKMEW